MTKRPAIEVALSTFDASWDAISTVAIDLDEAGIGGLWVMDHFSGAVHGRSSVLECWSTLAGLAQVTRHCRLGSLVTNASVRRPVIVAQTAATIQEQSGGRLIVGVGAGGGVPGTAYADEVQWVGATNESAAIRRTSLAQMISTVRQTWTGAVGPEAGGFLVPSPPPPIIVGGYGPKVASIAGSVADGFNTSASNPDLIIAIDSARSARHMRQQSSHTSEPFTISAFAPATQNVLDPRTGELERLADAGVDTIQIILGAPFEPSVLESVLTCAALG